ncbi:MAG: hypothetical protein WC812_02540 [Candidatus Pacearchaeota archaeon]|jgi:hypothetical protein
MTFKVLEIAYEKYVEKILPYITENYNRVNNKPVRAYLPGATMHSLKKGVIQTNLDLEDMKSPKMKIYINPLIRDNKKIIEELEKLIKGEEN